MAHIVTFDASLNLSFSTPEQVFQGSVGINKLTVLAPVLSNSIVQVSYNVPNGNGSALPIKTMSPLGNVDDTLNGWELEYDSTLTEYSGIVDYTIYISTSAGQTITTGIGNFTVEPTIAPGSAVFSITDNDISITDSDITGPSQRNANADFNSRLDTLDSQVGILDNYNFPDDETRIQNGTDTTKELAFDVSGISTGTLRTITIPDTDVDLSDIAISNAHIIETTGAHEATAISYDNTDDNYITTINVEAAIKELDNALQSAGRTSFGDGELSIYNEDYTTLPGTLEFDASAITDGAHRVISMPDENVDLGAISAISGNTANIATNTTDIETNTTDISAYDGRLNILETYSMPVASFKVADSINGGIIDFDISAISNLTTRTITIPDTDIDLSDIADNTTNISTNTADISTLDTLTSGHTTSIGTNTTDIGTNDGRLTVLETYSMPVASFKVADVVNGGVIDFDISSISNLVTRTIIVPDTDIDLGDIVVNTSDISTLDTLTSGHTTSIGTNTTDIGVNDGRLTVLETYSMPDDKLKIYNETNEGIMSFDVSGVSQLVNRVVTMPNTDVDLGDIATIATHTTDISAIEAAITGISYSDAGSVDTTTIDNNLVISKNLTVNGTTTYVNTEQLNLADNIILINSDYTGNTPTENGGLEVNRGLQTNYQFLFNESYGDFRLGLKNDLQPVLTRTETVSLSDDDFLLWDETSNRAYGQSFTDLDLATETDLTSAEARITITETDIDTNDGRLTVLETYSMPVGDFKVADSTNGGVIDFDISSISNLTTRTITMPNTDIDLSDIATNTSDISTLDTLTSGHTTTIGTNTTDIGANDGRLTVLETYSMPVASFKVADVVNGGVIDFDISSISNLTTRTIIVPDTDIDLSDIADNTTNISTNTADISTLDTLTSGHTTSIGTNTTDIDANDGRLTVLETYSMPVATFKVADSTNGGVIDFDISSISNLVTRTITVPDTNIDLSDIATNTSDISTLDTLTSGHTTTIGTNTTDIDANDGRLTILETYSMPVGDFKVADSTNGGIIDFDISSISNLVTRTITIPDTDIDLGDIATNTSTITGLDTLTDTQTTNISTNTTNISDHEDRVAILETYSIPDNKLSVYNETNEGIAKFDTSEITQLTVRTITVPDTNIDLGDIATNATNIASNTSDIGDKVETSTYNTHTGSTGNGGHLPSAGAAGEFLYADGSFQTPSYYTGWTISDGSTSETINSTNILTVQGQNGIEVIYNSGNNELNIGISDAYDLNEVTITNDSVSDTPITVQGISNTTADLQQFKVSTATVATVEADGSFNTTTKYKYGSNAHSEYNAIDGSIDFKFS